MHKGQHSTEQHSTAQQAGHPHAALTIPVLLLCARVSIFGGPESTSPHSHAEGTTMKLVMQPSSRTLVRATVK